MARPPVDVAIQVDDPRTPDVRDLIGVHLAFSRAATPAAFVFALDVDGLLDDKVTFFSARRQGALVGIGALKELDARHGELKSMHTVAAERGRGIGRAIVEHLMAVARERGYERLSLETGAMDAYAPARALYAHAGFAPCPPFADYTENPHSVCMTRRVD